MGGGAEWGVTDATANLSFEHVVNNSKAGLSMNETERQLIGSGEVCWRDHFGSEGSAREYLVRLPDGFLLSCGIDGYSSHRAKAIAAALSNAGSPA